MRSKPGDLDDEHLVRALSVDWGIEVSTLLYAPLGGGSHHWDMLDRSGERWFVTVDDLDQKPWFGDGRESALRGLRRCYQIAIALRESGLDFVIAPIRTGGGEPLRRLSDRYSVSLLPFVDGTPGEFGQYDQAEQKAIPMLLARLHAQTPTVMDLAPRLTLEIPGRVSLEQALREIAEPWSGGPLSENARHVVAQGSSRVVELLAVADRLSAQLAASDDGWVITHGEPHGGNLMRTANGHVLIDWDTVAIAPRERDLWMLVPRDADEDPVYASATGQRLDPAALAHFRLRWDLADIAAFTEQLRRPHLRNEDAERALTNLTYYLDAG